MVKESYLGQSVALKALSMPIWTVNAKSMSENRKQKEQI